MVSGRSMDEAFATPAEALEYELRIRLAQKPGLALMSPALIADLTRAGLLEPNPWPVSIRCMVPSKPLDAEWCRSTSKELVELTLAEIGVDDSVSDGTRTRAFDDVKNALKRLARDIHRQRLMWAEHSSVVYDKATGTRLLARRARQKALGARKRES